MPQAQPIIDPVTHHAGADDPAFVVALVLELPLRSGETTSHAWERFTRSVSVFERTDSLREPLAFVRPLRVSPALATTRGAVARADLAVTVADRTGPLPEASDLCRCRYCGADHSASASPSDLCADARRELATVAELVELASDRGERG